MKKFDFLSESPQMLFFQKESNKTSFGGILFIICITFVSLLSIILILDFCLNDKYEIHYSLIRNDESVTEMPVNDEMDPLLNFSIDLFKMDEDLDPIELNDKYIIYDSDLNLIKRNSIIQKRPSELFFLIVYNDTNKESNSNEEDEVNFGYYFEIEYQGFKLHHQKSIPLITNESDIYFSEDYPFSLNKTTMYIIDWEILKYIENRGIYGLFDGILKRKSEYISGYIASDISISRDKPFDISGFKILSIVQMKNMFEQYTEYVRKKNDILELIANIGSLFSTFFSVFIFIFKFYSKNIDNYQIIEKLLSKPKKMNFFTKKENEKKIEINYINKNRNNNNQSDTTKVGMLAINNLIKKDFDLLRINNETKTILETKNKLETKNNQLINEIKNIKKLSFKHFFLKGFNLKCFNGRNENKVIDLCNYILSKYISLDLILYNQIIFENLLEDYKWNNPDLNNIHKNKLIFRLINII